MKSTYQETDLSSCRNMSNNTEKLLPVENSFLPHSEDFRCKSRVRLFDCGISQKNILSIERKPRSNTYKHRCFSIQKKLAPLQAREANRTFQSNFGVLRLFLRFANILQNPVGEWFILPSTLTHIASKGIDLLY